MGDLPLLEEAGPDRRRAPAARAPHRPHLHPARAAEDQRLAHEQPRDPARPAGRASHRLRLSAAGQHPSFCTMRLVSTGLAIVHIPVTQDGAVYIDERHTLFDIRNAVYTAADDAQGAAADVRARRPVRGPIRVRGRMVALRPPTPLPPAGTIGIFSDGAHHFEAVALSTLGRRRSTTSRRRADHQRHPVPDRSRRRLEPERPASSHGRS